MIAFLPFTTNFFKTCPCPAFLHPTLSSDSFLSGFYHHHSTDRILPGVPVTTWWSASSFYTTVAQSHGAPLASPFMDSADFSPPSGHSISASCPGSPPLSGWWDFRSPGPQGPLVHSVLSLGRSFMLLISALLLQYIHLWLLRWPLSILLSFQKHVRTPPSPWDMVMNMSVSDTCPFRAEALRVSMPYATSPFSDLTAVEASVETEPSSAWSPSVCDKHSLLDDPFWTCGLLRNVLLIMALRSGFNLLIMSLLFWYQGTADLIKWSGKGSLPIYFLKMCVLVLSLP